MSPDPYRYFRVEARDLLDQLARGALDLEKPEGGAEQVAKLLRLAHTLKGAARVVKQVEIADLAHEIEDVLAPLRSETAAATRSDADAILGRLDAIGVHVGALAPAAPGFEPGALRPEGPLRGADAAELDALLDRIAEARVGLASLRRKLEALDEARTLAAALVERASSRREPAAPRRSAARPDDAGAMAVELQACLGGLRRGASASMDQIDRDLRQLRGAGERLRLVPASVLFNALERTARDAAQALGKQVRFEAHGGEIRMDAHVVAVVQNALVQLVRNGVAHGIERAGQRAGKPAEGCIRLTIARHGRRTAIRCEDDGAGVDLEAVRRAAARGGLLPAAGVGKPSTDALLRLLLSGGVTTSPAVTGVAGRGVGLDVVRETAERLGGEVSIRSEAGQGTAVELLLPLSATSLQVLLADTGAGVAAIPLDAVRGVVRLQPTDLAQSAQGETLLYDGQAIPFVPLAALLGLAAGGRGSRPGAAVVLQGDGAVAALGLERPLGVAVVVPHPLPELAPPTPLAAGVAIDEDGLPQLVLDADQLVRRARRAEGAQEPPPAAPPTLLVVDDSLTTRMLEQSILETAGYRVHAAKSAEEALEVARGERYALFLVDVEMPGMDGFAFLERVRRDPALRETPAILVTSRSSAEDRRRGEEVGAQGYIVKSEFDQTAFLQGVRRLVG